MSWETWLLPPILLIIMSYLPSIQSFFAQTLGWGRSDSSSSSSSSRPSAVSSASSGAPNSHSAETHAYQPSPKDVLVAKLMLQQGLNLPAEVVLSILDFAEYWPHTSAILDSSFITPSGRDSENRFVLRTRPLGLIKRTQKDEHSYTFSRVSPQPLPECAEYPLSHFQACIGGPTDTIQHPCRKIVFTITSHDQGWSNTARLDRGSYRGSYTWFEAGLERFEKNAVPKDAAEGKIDLASSVKESVSKEEAPHDGVPKEKDSAEEVSGEKVDSPPDNTESDDDDSNSCLPVHALRPIYPTLEADAEPPAFHFDLLPSPQYTIQYNKTATRTPTTHTIVWSWKDDIDPPTAQQLRDIGRGEETGTGAFVRNLKLGDVVTVWAKSRFGGWANHVDAVKVDVYWAF